MKYELELWQQSNWQKDTRFYCLELRQDLFGNWIVKRTWGSSVKQVLVVLCLQFALTIKQACLAMKNKLLVVKSVVISFIDIK